MIRRLLPQLLPIDLFALDAALLRGDVLVARKAVAELDAALHANSQIRLHVSLRAGAIAYLANQMDEARNLGGVIVSMASDGSNTDLAAAAHLLLALTYIDQKQEVDARAALLVARGLYQNRILPAAYCRLASCTLDLYFNRYDAAVSGLTELISLFEHQGEAWGQWQAERLMGLVAHQRTRFADALQLLTSSRQGFAALGDFYEVARCDKALANTYRRLSRPSDAMLHAEQALAYFGQQQLIIPTARCQNTLGSIQLEFDQEAGAMVSFQAAAEGFQLAGLDLELAGVLHNLGLLYRFQGQFRLALAALARARAIAANLKIRDVEAAVAEQQASVSRHVGQPDVALEHLRVAADIYADLGASLHAAGCWLDMANLLIEEGRYAEAMPLLRACRTVFNDASDVARVALADIGLARLHLADHRQELAIPLLIDASRQLHQRRHIRQGALADIWLGSANLEVDQTDEAEAAFQRARESAAIGSFDISWRAAAGLAVLARQRSDWDLLLNYLEEAMSSLNRLRAAALSPQAASRLSLESLPVYQQAIDVALEHSDSQRALTILENQKALHFAQQFMDIQARSKDAPVDWRLPPVPRHGIDPTRQIANRLEYLRQALIVPAEESHHQRLEQLEAEFQHLAESLAAHDAPYAVLYQPPPTRIEQLRSLLDARHGVGQWGCLSYGWLGEGPSLLYRFWFDSEHLLTSTIPMSHLHRRLVGLACRPEPSYRRHLLNWRTPAAAPSEWHFLQALLIPADFASNLAKVQTLYLSPSGPLSAFPFAALAVDDQCLGLRCAMSQVPSLPLLEALLARSNGLPAPRPLAETRGLVCALSTFPARPGASDIPATVREIDSLAGAIGPASLVLRNEQATYDRLRQLHANGELAEYDLLHFATHAYLNPYHSHLACLVMWDGDVYVADIMAWRLRAHLVVLAACDTAAGHSYTGDEQMGLPHASLLAGADALLASMQPIPDELAADFVKAFYDTLASGGLFSSQALLSARRRYAANGHTPLDWSAFTLVGLA